MSPKQIADLISRTRRSAYQENKGQVRFRGEFSDTQDREAWATLLSDGSPFLNDVVVRDIASDAQYEAEDLPETGTVIRFVLTKPTSDHVAHLFSAAALPIIEREIDDVRLFRIAGFEKNEEFATYRAFFRQWDDVEGQIPRTNPELTDPRRFSKDFSGDDLVREDIRPWLLNDPPEKQGDFFDQWALIAGKYVLASLARRRGQI